MSDWKVLRASEAPDFTGDAPDGAFLGYGRPLGAEQIAFNLRVLAPGAAHVPPGMERGSGHSHRTIEEIYFVVDGQITIKVGEEILRLDAHDAVLVPPEVPRAMRNDSEHPATVAMLSARVSDPHAEVRWHEGLWPAD